MTMNTRVITGAVLLWLVGVQAASADTGGFFLGVGQAQVDIGGDMDGETFVAGGGSAEVLPDQDDGDGIKYALGYYFEGGAFELSWVDTDHDGEWAGLPFDSNYRSLNMDVKLPVLGKERLHGQVILGIGFSCVEVEDGSTDGLRTEDATFNGLDFRLGVGVSYDLTENFVVQANLVRRYGSYDDVDGIVDGSLSDDLDGDGTTVSFELLWVFPD